MRKTLVALGLVIALAGCNSGGGVAPTAGTGGPGATSPGGAPGASRPGGNAAGSFCDAAARLQFADQGNRQEIQRGLEAAIPAGQEEAVATIRTFMERQAAGDDPYKDPTFLLEYDDAVHDLWEHCGLE